MSSKPKGTGDEDADSTLGAYFKEMSGLDVMSPEEELAAATRIAQFRIEYWRRLLAYPPFIDGIVALVEESLDSEDVPTAELRSIRKTARALRDRETRSNKDQFEHSRAALADALSSIDTDGIVSDRILEELQAIDGGQRSGLSLAVRPPRRGSQPYKEYVERAARAQFALRTAKHRFVKSNLRLVVSIARRFNHGRMPLQDLIQEGNIGLMKAVDRFDHRKGFRFSTYGSWWIRHAISRAIADKGRAVRLPVHMIDAHHKVSKARRELELLHGREPTPEELATHTGLAAAKIEKMQTLLLEQPVSLDRPVSDADGRKVVDFLEDEETEQPGDSMEADAINEQVRQVITGLRPIEADILRKRFGLEYDEELTLKEIGEQYSLSRERIRQLQEQALGKIRRELRRRDML
ncbi:sigma-70 family RNA polymerase sigma factor [Paraliomyxa miuraensis]|uniref:sigma-70 family RNA polymerase sigma factor n=1 Tax=Paraliomyxa miuraensis TaxID=376150 RepID=UPI00225AF5E5|nr:sigma-70 family RNA polymerase sigma factor [Paraliomyxa miuraensis]MCX4242371.1 sigma-70 family RNA polymerase sigma factor [Paraliomyxa miuraensis]